MRNKVHMKEVIQMILSHRFLGWEICQRELPTFCSGPTLNLILQKKYEFFFIYHIEIFYESSFHLVSWSPKKRYWDLSFCTGWYNSKYYIGRWTCGNCCQTNWRWSLSQVSGLETFFLMNFLWRSIFFSLSKPYTSHSSSHGSQSSSKICN